MTRELDAALNLYKKKSETPLQTIERHVAAHPEYKKSKMTYAGRLDPMAEGVLVVLAGEKNKEREAYTGLDKDYEFEFVPGIETDTFDILGRITAARASSATEADVKKALLGYSGKISQRYPPYSSKVLNGAPLFELARKGLLKDSDIPSHEVEVKELKVTGSRSVSRDEFRRYIYESIGAVTGDFRQKEILKLWEGYFETAPDAFTVYNAFISCGSGFYVRQLVSDIGRKLGTGAVTISILRTRVGDFKLEDSLR